jgi:ATP-dependent Zn protease
MNEAAILAARRDLKEISKDEISDALERIIARPEKNIVVSEEKKKLVAYHGKFYFITMYCNLNSSWGPCIANRLFEF